MIKNDIEDYRIGATGSLMDEYERALFELKSVVQNIDEVNYSQIIEGESEHCCSIEVIMNHVVGAGRRYSNYIREALSMETFPVVEKKIALDEIASEIDKMFAYTVEIFDGRWKDLDEEMTSVYMDSRWGIRYNIDQMLEHAIVHTLRHRRQIQKFLLIINK